MNDLFYKKQGLIVQNLAVDLLQLKIGDKINSISAYQAQYKVARGTIQNAFNYLKEQHAVTLLHRGYLGSFIADIDYFILKKYALPETVLGTMTLPYSKLYEGFATGLYYIFDKNKINLNLAYLRGAKERINSINRKIYRFAITSRYTANDAIQKGNPIDIIADFGPHTYLSQHVILFANKNNAMIDDGMRLGIDYSSIDQERLTKKLSLNKKISLVKTAGHQIIDALEQGIIDAGVWNYDEIKNKNNQLTYVIPKIDQDILDMTSAVIVCHKEDHVIKTIFDKILSKDDVLTLQKQVVAGQIVPRY